MEDQMIKVLLVEDDEDDYVTAREMLSAVKGWKCHLKWVATYDAALEETKQCQYDICFMDYRLGERDGLELLREFQDNGFKAPVIFLTGLGDRELDLEAMVTGAADYLEKAELNANVLERSIRYSIENFKTMEALRKSEARFRGIFSGAAIGIALMDRQGRITESNPALSAMLGYRKAELRDMDLRDFSHGDDVQQMMSFYENLERRKEGHYQVETRFIRRDANWIWGRLTISLLKEAEDASLLAICMVEDITERKKATEALQESEKQLRILSSKLLETQEKERKLVAQELHDSVGASLAAIRYSLEKKLADMGESPPSDGVSVERIISIVEETIKETKRISTNLRPPMLDDLGILATIRWLCREFQEVYSDIRVEKQLSVQENEIPEALKIVIYRILQETLNNVAKYSQADLVRLSLRKRKDSIELAIDDNGRGFEPGQIHGKDPGVGGMGLAGMKERTKLSGGTFELKSGIGKGTSIRTSWPLDRKEGKAE